MLHAFVIAQIFVFDLFAGILYASRQSQRNCEYENSYNALHTVDFIGGTGGDLKDARSEGRIYAISWGISKAFREYDYNALGHLRFKSDDPQTNITFGTDPVDFCAPFELDEYDHIMGYRVLYRDFVHGLYFYTRSGLSYECVANLSKETQIIDSGEEYVNNTFLSGFVMKAGGVIDSIQFYFTECVYPSTKEPTLNPTSSPTKHPTLLPTANPIKAPTVNPTIYPTVTTTHVTVTPIISGVKIVKLANITYWTAFFTTKPSSFLSTSDQNYTIYAEDKGAFYLVVIIVAGISCISCILFMFCMKILFDKYQTSKLKVVHNIISHNNNNDGTQAKSQRQASFISEHSEDIQLQHVIEDGNEGVEMQDRRERETVEGECYESDMNLSDNNKAIDSNLNTTRIETVGESN